MLLSVLLTCYFRCFYFQYDCNCNSNSNSNLDADASLYFLRLCCCITTDDETTKLSSPVATFKFLFFLVYFLFAFCALLPPFSCCFNSQSLYLIALTTWLSVCFSWAHQHTPAHTSSHTRTPFVHTYIIIFIFYVINKQKKQRLSLSLPSMLRFSKKAHHTPQQQRSDE